MNSQVLITTSLTGRGHLTSALAIAEALQSLGVPTVVDQSFLDYAPFPHKYAPEIYAWLSQHSKIGWEILFRLLETPVGSYTTNGAMYGFAKNWLHDLNAQDYNFIVCTHGMLAYPLTRFVHELEYQKPKVVNVILDIQRVHKTWLLPDFDLTFVPNEEVAQFAKHCGVPPERIIVAGLPLASVWFEPYSKAEIYVELGLDSNMPVVVVMGGGMVLDEFKRLCVH